MGLLIAITAFGMIVLGLPDGVLGVAWPSMSTSFGVSLAALGAISLVFTGAYTASGFLSGWFLRKISLGALLASSASVMGVGFLGYALMPGWWALLIAVGIAGLGGGTLDAGMNVFAAGNLSTRGINWLHSSFSIGAFAAAPVMTGLLVTGVDWRWAFVAIGGLLAILALTFWSPPSRRRSDWAVGGATSDESRLSETLRLPMVWISVGVFALYTGLEVCAGVWSFTLLTEERGLSVGTAGGWTTAYFGGLVAGRLVLGSLAEQVPPPRLLWISAALSASGAFVFWLAPVDALGLIGLISLGVGLGPIFPTLISTTAERVGDRHTHNAVGFQIAAAALGAGLFPGAVGLIASATSLEAIAAALAVGGALLLVMLLLIDVTTNEGQVPTRAG